MSSLDRAQRRAERERQARKQAEFLLEQKSRELYESNLQLTQAKEELEARVRERTEQLEQALAQSESARKAKTEFLAMMSHEIRTPMTAILGFTELILEEEQAARDPSSQLDSIRTIHRNGQHLLDIINDILDISKIEAGKLEVELRPCSPVAIVEHVRDLMRVRAQDKGIQFETSIETELPRLIATDATRLRQILINILGNAIKFTSQGSVRLLVRHLEGDAAKLEFDVIDSGIGITAEQQQQLFQPFSQADMSMARRFGGTGLGLSISKRLTQMLGGDVWIVESSPNQGTRFRVQIKAQSIQSGELDDAQIRADQREMVSDLASSTPLSECRILLAEDGPDNRRLLTFILEKAGAQVTTVENGSLAIEQVLSSLETQPFDLILMDMQMPILDGYQATSQLRGLGCRTPIIALTAHAMSDSCDRCLASGCDDFASKPIDRTSLIAQIQRWARGESQSTIV